MEEGQQQGRGSSRQPSSGHQQQRSAGRASSEEGRVPLAARLNFGGGQGKGAVGVPAKPAAPKQQQQKQQQEQQQKPQARASVLDRIGR